MAPATLVLLRHSEMIRAALLIVRDFRLKARQEHGEQYDREEYNKWRQRVQDDKSISWWLTENENHKFLHNNCLSSDDLR